METSTPPRKKSKLTDAERLRIERNRQKALNIKSAKLTAHPNANNTKTEIDASGKSIIKIYGTKYVDSGGGFLIEEAIGNGTANDASSSGAGKSQDFTEHEINNEIDEAIPIPISYYQCVECQQQFAESYLMLNFNYACCDICRDDEEKHSLITRTEAKQEYLLKDCDLDKREPPLRFLLRKNPHNVRWGEMKLYLHLQVEKRALEVWGSEEKLLEERDIRDEKRDKSKLKKYNNNLKKLRMEVRSSLFDRTSAGPHQHEFGTETYNEDDDNYQHTCKTCGLSETYDKM